MFALMQSHSWLKAMWQPQRIALLPKQLAYLWKGELVRKLDMQYYIRFSLFAKVLNQLWS
ncbi:hypothetical protein GsuE55_36410 [Geobacillus subterraneus]|uniref:Uncharacterized protein n=1 Tax=Geobacillus subterraneus TaxID=129338 RepID=A0A679FQI0_9BACL|nr:hypothetical protein GsuE55_36410 [Geobacillus subterraneus]